MIVKLIDTGAAMTYSKDVSVDTFRANATLSSAMSMTFISLALLVLPPSAEARIKCWENSDGVRECGENVPPEYSQKRHEEISSQGITLEESERAKTDEERLEEERLAAIEEEKARIKAEQAAQDKILLDTYSNTDDIEMTRNGSVAAIDSTINLANKRNEKLQAELDKRTAAAAAQELAGKQPSEDLVKDIRSLQRQVKNNEKFIADKLSEKEQVKIEYTEKIDRFLELTGQSKQPLSVE